MPNTLVISFIFYFSVVYDFIVYICHVVHVNNAAVPFVNFPFVLKPLLSHCEQFDRNIRNTRIS